MIKYCNYCKCELNQLNRAGKHLACKPCRVKLSSEYRKNNLEARRAYMRKYIRKIGRVKQYPCKTCNELCYKKYALAFCSDKCRLLSYVQKTETCWLWTGAKNRQGYGKMCFQGNKTMPSHRASYILFNGPIEDNKLVCHHCDVKNCVNPEHLWLGNHMENMMDMVEKDRQHSRLSPVDVYKIREMFEKLRISRKKIMEKFNISSGYLSQILNGKTRKYI